MAQEYLSAGLVGPSESFVDGLSVAGAVVIDCVVVVAAMTVVVGLAVVGVEVDTVVDAALVVVDTGTVVEAAGEVVVDVTLCSSSNSSVGSSRACISGEFEAPHADPISNTQSRAAAERIL